MTITAKDISRLAWELEEIPSGEPWCKKRGIEFEAVSGIVSFHTHELLDAINGNCEEEIDIPLSIAYAIGNAFRLGWEVRHQYGVGAEEIPDDAA